MSADPNGIVADLEKSERGCEPGCALRSPCANGKVEPAPPVEEIAFDSNQRRFKAAPDAPSTHVSQASWVIRMRKLLEERSQRKGAVFLALGCIAAFLLLTFAPSFDAASRVSSHLALWHTWTGSLILGEIPTAPKLADGYPSPADVSRAADDGQYLLGVGKADITGPVVEIGFMGYANNSQVGTGLRQRLYSRSFIIAEAKDPSSTIVYTIIDTQSGDISIRRGIIETLQAKGGDLAHYARSNFALVGTHSHSGPGAWLNYFLPQFTTHGFNREAYQAIVDGVVLSIQRAHDSLAPGSLSFGATRLEDANINRSLFAYLANPADERAKYGNDTVDKDLTMLKFTRASDGKDIGFLSWFPVHGTSMLGNNTLVTGDNKGVAASLVEKAQSTPGFVAGFSQANVGDTSPNINGAYCEGGKDDGKQCTPDHSTCDGKNEPCHGRGPFFGLNDAGTESCYEIGKRQSDAAQRLLSNKDSFTAITGPVRSVHQYVDLSSYSFTLQNGTTVQTCSAALGYSFAAGTTDGPGAFDFTQNDPDDVKKNPLWKIISGIIHKPSKEQIACQSPKPILFDAGATTTPYEWAPNIVPVQLLRVGQLYMIISPGEATTTSGRRWKAALADKIQGLEQEKEPIVVLGAPANSYTHYISTPEEYAIQRYEGASTLYGPNTLPAYIAKSNELLTYLSPTPPTVPLSAGPDPPDNRNKSISFIPKVIYDSPGLLHSFGDVTIQPAERYSPSTTASAQFRGANPRNNFRLEKSYASVQVLAQGEWITWRDDSDWELVFEWRRSGFSEVLGESLVTLSWEVPGDVPAGIYRFVYQGDSKTLGGIREFEGFSRQFSIVR